MRKCTHCGRNVPDTISECPICFNHENKTSRDYAEIATANIDFVDSSEREVLPIYKVNIWLLLLALILPITGIYNGFALKKTNPKTAKICSCVGWILSLLIIAGIIGIYCLERSYYYQFLDFANNIISDLNLCVKIFNN
ncbi:MAG: hypothetical protein ACI37Z_05210 [Candidatus Gastranaerophilaceae bacterium]